MKYFNVLKIFKHTTIISMLFLSGLSNIAQAENRALIIGVGEYEDSTNNLPGIDLDVNMMLDVASYLGFEEDNIKVLEDEDATLENVRKAFKTWLRDGVKSSDRVLVYYSGHGTRIPDEDGDETEDHSDEVITMYEVESIQRNGVNTLSGVLIDDELGRLLKQIPSDNVFVMIDACNSGTATKSIRLADLSTGVDTAYAKFYSYRGMPKSSSTRGFFPTEKTSGLNYVALTAARDDELSRATNRGSAFTLGIKDSVDLANASKNNLTISRMLSDVSDFLSQMYSGSMQNMLFHPQLNGSKTLAEQKLIVSYIDDGYGPSWREVQEVVNDLKPLTVRYNKSAYRDGENMEMEVDVPYRGYLNIINIQPDDLAIVMFPNSFHSNSLVEAGTIKIPGTKGFELPAGAPYGENLIAVFLSKEPMNMYNDGVGRRDKRGNMLDSFPALSAYSMRGFKPTESKPQSTTVNANGLSGSMKIVKINP